MGIIIFLQTPTDEIVKRFKCKYLKYAFDLLFYYMLIER